MIQSDTLLIHYFNNCYKFWNQRDAEKILCKLLEVMVKTQTNNFCQINIVACFLMTPQFVNILDYNKNTKILIISVKVKDIKLLSSLLYCCRRFIFYHSLHRFNIELKGSFCVFDLFHTKCPSNYRRTNSLTSCLYTFWIFLLNSLTLLILLYE